MMKAGVFPAYAGMFLAALEAATLALRFPRIRGDVPGSDSIVTQPKAFSPHTRGCSRQAPDIRTGDIVFPAYAGMFPA